MSNITEALAPDKHNNGRFQAFITSYRQHDSIERLTLRSTRREKRADDVIVTSFPVSANQCGKRPPTIDSTCMAYRDTKSITCLSESPNACSFCIYDVSVTKHVIRIFGTFLFKNRKRYCHGNFCTASTQLGEGTGIEKTVKMTTLVFGGHLGF